MRQLDVMSLDDYEKRRILRTIARKVRTYAKKRIRNQQDLKGKQFKTRADGGKKKMLRGLSKSMKVFASADTGKIYFQKYAGIIGARQQQGYTEEWDAAKAKKVYGKTDKLTHDDPATRRQAKKLRELGYKIRRGKGGKWKRPTLKWTMENISMGQAGIIVRMLRGGAKEKWKTIIPARSFLGTTEREERELLNLLSDLVVRYR